MCHYGGFWLRKIHRYEYYRLSRSSHVRIVLPRKSRCFSTPRRESRDYPQSKTGFRVSAIPSFAPDERPRKRYATHDLRGVAANERKERAIAALTRVKLDNRLHNKPNQLSGGQQQRVAIARAIVNQPILLLADEPTGALDSKTTREVIDIFEELNQSGITVVVVTHEADVARHSKRIVWFKDGEIIHSDLSPDALHEVIF